MTSSAGSSLNCERDTGALMSLEVFALILSFPRNFVFQEKGYKAP